MMDSVRNVGHNNERSIADMVKAILSELYCSEDLISYVIDRKGYGCRCTSIRQR